MGTVGCCGCASPTRASSRSCCRPRTTARTSARRRGPAETNAAVAKNPYSPHTPADRAAMLARIGVKSVDDLFAAIPKDARDPKLGIGPGMSEMEVQAHLESLARMDRDASSGPFFIGGPIQRRYIPAALPVLALRGEFLTAYTPYQPEVSQGTLQAVFEYQSLMAEL